MSTEPKDIAFQVAFQCPRCKATLQIQAQPAGSWVRCPKCGRASLAPDPVVRRAPEPIKPEDDALILGPMPEYKPMTPLSFAGDDPENLSEPANPFRVAAGAGFCVAAILGVFSALEASEIGIIAFGILAAVCLIPLLRFPAHE